MTQKDIMMLLKDLDVCLTESVFKKICIFEKITKHYFLENSRGDEEIILDWLTDLINIIDIEDDSKNATTCCSIYFDLDIPGIKTALALSATNVKTFTPNSFNENQEKKQQIVKKKVKQIIVTTNNNSFLIDKMSILQKIFGFHYDYDAVNRKLRKKSNGEIPDCDIVFFEALSHKIDNLQKEIIRLIDRFYFNLSDEALDKFHLDLSNEELKSYRSSQETLKEIAKNYKIKSLKDYYDICKKINEFLSSISNNDLKQHVLYAKNQNILNSIFLFFDNCCLFNIASEYYYDFDGAEIIVHDLLGKYKHLHCEIKLMQHLLDKNISDKYIGVSKGCCILCSLLLQTFGFRYFTVDINIGTCKGWISPNFQNLSGNRNTFSEPIVNKFSKEIDKLKNLMIEIKNDEINKKNDLEGSNNQDNKDKNSDYSNKYNKPCLSNIDFSNRKILKNGNDYKNNVPSYETLNEMHKNLEMEWKSLDKLYDQIKMASQTGATSSSIETATSTN